MIGKFVLLGCVALLHQTDSLKLPPYIKPCQRSDPNFNECAKKHGQEALATLIKGDKQYKIPELNPLILSEVNFKQGSKFDLSLKNVKMFGFDKLIIEKTNFDFKKKHISYDVKIPKLEISCDYQIAGKILNLPIRGKGPAKLAFDDLELNYSYDFDLTTKDSVEYISSRKGVTKFDTKLFSIKFDNLFDGDKVLGAEAQMFLDENWKEILQELKPTISGAFTKIVHLVTSHLSETVPFNELYPEKF